MSVIGLLFVRSLWFNFLSFQYTQQLVSERVLCAGKAYVWFLCDIIIIVVVVIIIFIFIIAILILVIIILTS